MATMVAISLVQPISPEESNILDIVGGRGNSAICSPRGLVRSPLLSIAPSKNNYVYYSIASCK